MGANNVKFRTINLEFNVNLNKKAEKGAIYLISGIQSSYFIPEVAARYSSSFLIIGGGFQYYLYKDKVMLYADLKGFPYFVGFSLWPGVAIKI